MEPSTPNLKSNLSQETPSQRGLADTIAAPDEDPNFRMGPGAAHSDPPGQAPCTELMRLCSRGQRTWGCWLRGARAPPLCFSFSGYAGGRPEGPGSGDQPRLRDSLIHQASLVTSTLAPNLGGQSKAPRAWQTQGRHASPLHSRLTHSSLSYIRPPFLQWLKVVIDGPRERSQRPGPG